MIKNRLQKIGKVLLIYLGGSWAVLESLGFIEGRFNWPEELWNTVFLLVIFGIPFLILWNWFYDWKNRYALILQGINFLLAVWFVTGEVKAWIHVKKAAPGEGEIKAIAVLPFKNLTGKADFENIVEGIQESVANELGEVGLFVVLSTSSTCKYKNTEMTIPEISEELGVDALVEASVVGSFEKIRIQVGLMNGNPEKQLWSKSFDESVTNMLQFLSDVSKHIAGAVTNRFNFQSEKKEKFPIEKEAVFAFMNGLHYSNLLTHDGL